MKKKTKIIQLDPFTLIRISPKYIPKTAINYNNNCIWETLNLLLCADSNADTKKNQNIHHLMYIYVFKCHITCVQCMLHATYNLSFSHQSPMLTVTAAGLPLLSPPLFTVGWFTKTELKMDTGDTDSLDVSG